VSGKNARIISVGLIIVVTAVVFLSALGNGFTNWDDDKFLTDNETIRRLDLPGIREMFTTSKAEYYGPFFFLSYAVEYYFFGYNAFIYHLDNVLLHIINSLLVFWLVLMLWGRVSVALITALLFGIHPLHSESVAWIAERKDTLSTVFYLLSMILYLTAKRRKYMLFLSLAVLCAVISFLVKPMAVSLPFVLLLCDVLEGRRIDAKALIEKAPFFILSVIFSAVTIHFQSEGAIRTKLVGNVLENILVSCKAIVIYLYKTILPVKLSALYEYPEDVSLTAGAYLLSAAAVIALIAAAIVTLRRTKVVFFSLFFFFVTIAPVIGIVPIGRHFVADRYMYIPSIGLFFLIAGFWHTVYRRRACGKIGRPVLAVALALFMLWLGVLTYNRNKVWANGRTLWEDVIEKYPDTAAAYNNLGCLYLDKAGRAAGKEEKEKNITRAEEFFARAVSIRPDYFRAYASLGSIALRRGRRDQAREFFRKGMESNPEFFPAYRELGKLLVQDGDVAGAIKVYEEYARINPDGDVYFELGCLYFAQKDYDEAKRCFVRAAEINPRSAPCRYNLASTYLLLGEYDRALSEFDRTLALDPPAALREEIKARKEKILREVRE